MGVKWYLRFSSGAWSCLCTQTQLPSWTLNKDKWERWRGKWKSIMRVCSPSLYIHQKDISLSGLLQWQLDAVDALRFWLQARTTQRFKRWKWTKSHDITRSEDTLLLTVTLPRNIPCRWNIYSHKCLSRVKSLAAGLLWVWCHCYKGAIHMKSTESFSHVICLAGFSFNKSFPLACEAAPSIAPCVTADSKGPCTWIHYAEHRVQSCGRE